MARRKKTALSIYLLDIAKALPWWISIIIAVGSWLYLQDIATSPIPSVTSRQNISQLFVPAFVKPLATIGQYLLPGVFCVGAFISLLSSIKRQKLHEDVIGGSKTINGLSWKEFEHFIAESFRRDGYDIAVNDSPGADGGVDVTLRKDGELFLVQCKQWRALKVGVPVVRELYGVMASRGAVGGFVVTSGVFTGEAKSFAEGRNITLIDGKGLDAWLKMDLPVTQQESVHQNPGCPICHSTMVKRIAKSGSNKGNEFWGCTHYPTCRGIRNI